MPAPRSRARGRTAPSAGCRRTATGSGCRRPACGCRSAPASPRRRPRSRLRRSTSRRRRAARASRSRCSRAIDQSGKMPSVCRSPATSATGPATGVSRIGAVEDCAAASRSGRGRRGPPRPTTSPAWATRLARVAGRAGGRGPDRQVARRGATRSARSRPRGDAAHGADQAVAVEGGGAGRAATTRPSRITDDPVGGGQDLAEEVRDQDHAAAARRRSGGRRRGAGRRARCRATRSARRG